MARIPTEEIERLKAEVSVQRLIEAKGIELRRHGADLVGPCPFHDDRTPSLVVTPQKNLWHCLGACQAGGSVIDWVMKAEGISFRHAVEFMRDGIPATSTPTKTPPIRAWTPKLASILQSQADDRELMSQVVSYYHETLKQSPEALAYLESRGLGSSELIDRFRLGYANRTLGYRLPSRSSAEGERVREKLRRIGILRSSGHEHFNGSLVVAIYDEHKAVTEMYGRKIRNDLKKGTPDHLYLAGPHRGVFNIEALQASREIILCESLIDAMTFWVAGFRNVTSSYGIKGLTQDHVDAFARYKTERVLIAYDRDDAGEAAANAASQRLNQQGIECFRIQFPYGTDANDCARGSKSPTSALGHAIRHATSIGQGKGVKLRQAPPVPPPALEPEQPQPFAEDTSPAISKEHDSDLPSPLASMAVGQAPEPVVSPVPPAPVELAFETDGDELHLTLGDRRWRVRGVGRNASFDLLRVNVFVATLDAKGATTDFHIDTLDLYSARARAIFTKAASEELRISEDVVKKDLGRVLLACEQVAEELIRKALEPAQKVVALTDAERDAAMKLLKDPGILNRILADFETCGVVGEETNKLVGYLAAVSRKLEEPLAVIVQSGSAAGKSSLMEAVLSFVPEEERVKFSAMTGQSLFYMGESDLAHKVLAIVEEEGASRASYALKLLQSEGELSIASTGKEPSTGRLVTHEYRVKGPVMIFLTTTAIDIDEELLSRCIVLTVNEDREQTKAIHRLQREAQTLEGLVTAKHRQRILKLHQDAQRLLKPILVANPFARQLTFASERTRTRRDHMKYLTLIRSIALLHQHQRRKKTVEIDGAEVAYIEVTLEDIRVANALAHEALGRSLDELAPQTKNMLIAIEEMTSARCAELEVKRCDYRFTRKDVRKATGCSDFQVRVHVDRLVDLEYLLVHRGGRGCSFVYELLYDGAGQGQTPFIIGLIDPDKLASQIAYDEKFEPPTADFEGSKRKFEPPKCPQSAPIEGATRPSENGDLPASLNQKTQELSTTPLNGKLSSRSHVVDKAFVASEDG